jgi:hypothetical protein
MDFTDAAASSLLIVETSEWFDWLRRELPLGGINLPSEETAVFFIGHALHLADRLRGAYRHLPDPMRQRLLKAAIVYQCWEQQRNLAERARIPLKRIITLHEVTATSYTMVLGASGRHHLVEASDGFHYIVTIPNGLWTETLPATELICNRLAGLMGLSVPGVAIVTLGPKLLALSDAAHPELRKRPRLSALPCCGFRQIERSERVTSAACERRLRREQRFTLLGSLAFDLWVANLRSSDDSVRCTQLPGVSISSPSEYSTGLMGGDWVRFLGYAGHLNPCSKTRLAPTDERDMRKWVRRIEKIDMNPLWELIFEMPSSWYGGNRATLAGILDKLQCRKHGISSEVDDLVRSNARRAGKLPCKTDDGCVLRLACRLGVA